MSTKQLIVFVPGYLTSAECASTHDTYHAFETSASARSVTLRYVSFPNNNRGDHGNTTVDACLEYAIATYNVICDDNKDHAIILAGHSMGGLIVLRMISSEFVGRLSRTPIGVRVVNPCIRTSSKIPVYLKMASTVYSFVPDAIKRVLSLPIPICEEGAMYPGSPCYNHNVKQRLISSVLQRTGGLYINNDAWNISPSPALIECTLIIQCTGDTVVCASSSATYAKLSKVRFINIESRYHEFFDDELLGYFWNE